MVTVTATLLAIFLFLFVKFEARSSVRKEVSKTVAMVREGRSSTDRTIAAMHLCEITNGDTSRQVDDQTLHSIVGLLDIDDDSLHYWVALCLGHNFGPRARIAEPKLLKILDEAHCPQRGQGVGEGICTGLKQIGAELPPKCKQCGLEP